MVKVFITGCTGFIAKNIVKLLIERGYEVVGTARSKAKGDKLREDLKSDKFSYEIVEDIIKSDAFDEALKKHADAGVVLHTASPFFYDSTDPENDLVIPAIEGTKNILNAVHKFGTKVERFVITSSDAAIYSYEDEQNGSLSFDETSWNNISYEDAIKDPISAYYGAKSFAEKAAWAFVKEHNPSFKLTAVNPVYVFGPQAFDSDAKGKLNTSNEMIQELITKGPDFNFENAKGGFIDVRDVALAHIKAFENADTVGKRLFMVSSHFSSQMILDILNERFPQLKGKIPVGKPGTGEEDIKTLSKVSNSATKDLLQFPFKSLAESVEDTVKQILKEN
ncbi:Piso0_001294 [Millerozyma farinosa CBS 7064]|uniref:Piso0_001294 protein n=1 Tax=Pichia sorbitophila (strain ATCC MYA-4447 / BCRC 22081 / CBS 7064 / NBRC 10061 / NRRL Y-12695) TaxID=559304 RepID=G8YDZ5_PICSO|nr:Piso0_001294 [Millerozyma farinosa CBS 7064]